MTADAAFAAPITEITRADHNRLFAVNVASTLFCTQAAARHMIARGRGTIINSGSQAGQSGERLVATYCATKAAVISLTQSAGQNLIAHGVTATPSPPRRRHARRAAGARLPVHGDHAGPFQQIRPPHRRSDRFPARAADNAAPVCAMTRPEIRIVFLTMTEGVYLISAATRPHERALAAKFGLVDPVPIPYEPFRQWVVEDSFA
jgi:hypothetical protein